MSVLINGAGIGGPVLAFWLSRAGISSVVYERTPTLSTSGQGIDIRGRAIEVVRRMGVEEAVRSQVTHEEGLAFINSSGKIVGGFPVTDDIGFSADIEIMRGDLCNVFYEASIKESESAAREGKDAGKVEYIFGDYVIGLEQQEDKVTVEFHNGGKRDFDIVVAADGQWSKTRKLAMGEANINHMGLYTAYFTIPKGKNDNRWANWYNAPGRRTILLRPDNDGCTRAYFNIMSDKPAGFYKLDVQGQKELISGYFEDAGWESKRIIDGCLKSEDFYMQEVVQVKMEKWSKGRVVLLGDAGYCPSPLSGSGTSLAIVGAYTLAGEIATHTLANHTAAFEAYEVIMRPIVTKAQNIPFSPSYANPETAVGISVLHGLVRLIKYSGLAAFIAKMGLGPQTNAVELKSYKIKGASPTGAV